MRHTMMMTPLYYIGFLLLLANGIPTSEGNELEKTVNGIQGGEGMMMALIDIVKPLFANNKMSSVGPEEKPPDYGMFVHVYLI